MRRAWKYGLRRFLYRQFYLSSTHWRNLRLDALRRARWRCQRCGKREATQVHHLTYERLGHERLADLLALCANCHRRIHQQQHWGVPLFLMSLIFSLLLYLALS